MTIYEFTDDMMKAHNALFEARAAFAAAVEAESREQSLTERHRQRWVGAVHTVSLNAPLMVKGVVEDVLTKEEINEKLKDVPVMGDGKFDYRKEAKALGIPLGKEGGGGARKKVDVLADIEQAKLGVCA